MKLRIDGKINQYYVQTLCMMLFPGVKFAEDEIETPDSTAAYVKTEPLYDGDAEIGVRASVTLRHDGREASSVHEMCYSALHTHEKTVKIVIGKCFFDAGELLLQYRPVWGILTGVRPAKLAMDYLNRGFDHEAVKAILREEMLVNPKKATLAADVALFEKTLADETTPDTCSVYISIPFCPTRCAYCSFVSYTSPKLLALIPDYLVKLCREIDETFRIIRENGKRVVTVYIGGGTPTTLNETQLEVLLSAVAKNIDVSALAEFTLEAGRPDTITNKKFEIAKKYGVTRVSINPQTLNDEILASIGRRHTVEDFLRAYDIARTSGIPHINTDLIAGLPEESFQSFSKSVDRILELRPDNITVHTFCVKKAAEILREGTDVYSRTGGETGKSVEYSHVSVTNAGYRPYYLYRQKNTVGNFENVGFCLPGTEGLYNILMMEELHSVFAVGAGAVTKLVSADRSHIDRIFSPKYPYEYLAADAPTTADTASADKIRQFFENDPSEK
ncbi:MAG: coproporphyrinogen dehydrogenase HemZ [Ruminococcaceae bacterium]|nr:coproporphyrinogen dehydrogenase HemZ [Oscillospiraceae bacterium]